MDNQGEIFDERELKLIASAYSGHFNRNHDDVAIIAKLTKMLDDVYDLKKSHDNDSDLGNALRDLAASWKHPRNWVHF